MDIFSEFKNRRLNHHHKQEEKIDRQIIIIVDSYRWLLTPGIAGFHIKNKWL